MQARKSGSPLLPKPVEQFRDYEHALPRVEQLYTLNHTHQMLDFVLAKKREYLPLTRKERYRTIRILVQELFPHPLPW
jgi:hypothetical protein